MKRIFKYLEHFWAGKDNKPSIRRLLSIIFSIDLVINFHKAGGIVLKIFSMIENNKVIDAQVLSATSGFLANIAMIIGAEAALVAALLSLTTYQNVQLTKTQIITNPDSEITSNPE